MIFRRDPKITFTTYPHLKDIIPDPVPARTVMPEWFKRLKPFVNDNPKDRTIKRCPPFIDILQTGWLIGAPADIYINITNNGADVEWQTDFTETVFEEHSHAQIVGHSKIPKPPLKFINYWQITTPPGWSCMFVPPVNRDLQYFEAISGIVDTDKYFEYINFPGFLIPTEGTIMIPRGEPIVQVIPFKRGFSKKAEIRAMNQKELDKLDLTRRRRSSKNSLYRDTMWVKK